METAPHPSTSQRAVREGFGEEGAAGTARGWGGGVRHRDPRGSLAAAGSGNSEIRPVSLGVGGRVRGSCCQGSTLGGSSSRATIWTRVTLSPWLGVFGPPVVSARPFLLWVGPWRRIQ